jgi:hypothetical protein
MCGAPLPFDPVAPPRIEPFYSVYAYNRDGLLWFPFTGECCG